MKRTTTTTTPGNIAAVRQAHPAGNMETVREAHAARKRRETLTAYRNAALLIICIFCGIFCGYIEAQAGTVKASRTAAQAATVKTAGTATQTGTVKTAQGKTHISKRGNDTRNTHTTTSSNDTRNAAHISRRDARKINDFCRTAYGPGYKIIIAPAETVTDKELQTRAGKRIIYVDQYQTTSRGKYGIVTTPGPFHGDRIRYATPAPRGRKIAVYLIYNPDSNSTDAVTAIISAGKIR